jgi:hypothetical protein
VADRLFEGEEAVLHVMRWPSILIAECRLEAPDRGGWGAALLARTGQMRGKERDELVRLET